MPQESRSRPASALSLPSDLEIRIERSFAAPREKVWRAFTDPTLLPQWMGPAQHTMTTSEMDASTGGTYRYVWDVEGQDLVIHGDVLDADAPSRMATRESMELGEPIPGHTLNLLLLNEQGGKTTAALHITFANKQARDGALASGMQDGMDEGYVRLDALLVDL